MHADCFTAVSGTWPESEFCVAPRRAPCRAHEIIRDGANGSGALRRAYRVRSDEQVKCLVPGAESTSGLRPQALPTHESAQHESDNQHQAEFELQLPRADHRTIVSLGAGVTGN
jgi:hypothetical protein